MKRLFINFTAVLAALCMLLSFSACGTEPAPEPAKTDPITALKALPQVVSVTPCETGVEDAAAYDLKFTSDDGELTIAAQLILPKDYFSSDAPLLYYFPEISWETRDLANGFVSEKLGVVRLFARGQGGSEGVRDLGGEDIADAVRLIRLCEESGISEGRRCYAAGSSEGSITALRLASLEAENLSGVAVVNVISDLAGLCEARGEGITAFAESLVGGSITDCPEEYQRRSAVTFADKLKIPVLLVDYANHPQFPAEQSDGLEQALRESGGNVQRYTVNKLSSDFTGEALAKLHEWLAHID